MAAGRDRWYSTLEIVPRQVFYRNSRQDRPLPTDLGKQTAPDEGKQVAPDEGKQVPVDDGKQHIGDDPGIELVAREEFCAPDLNDHDVKARQPSRKQWILYGGAVGSVVILAAVLGIVFGSRHRHKDSATTSLTRPSNVSTTSSPATSSPATSSTTTPSPTTSSPTTSSPTTSIQRNIAALSFLDKSINNTRVYFQDNAGQITEAATNANKITWEHRPVGVGGKNGSAIAAAVSRPGYPRAISVFYLDSNNLIHDVIFTSSTGNWSQGAISGQGYTAISNSSLSAMYNQCSLCANTTILAFQDENGLVQIGNLTSDGWTLTQLGSALDPRIGTGLALQPFYLNGSEDQINLFHQKSNLNLSLASWKPASSNNGVAGWSLNEQTYNAIPSGSSIAAASSYSEVSTGLETWIEVLSAFDKGLEVDTWSGAINGWLEQYEHPSAMANLTGNGKVYGSVAVTAIGRAFAVVRQDGHADEIQSWQVEDDLVDWSLVGNVDIGDAWE